MIIEGIILCAKSPLYIAIKTDIDKFEQITAKTHANKPWTKPIFDLGSYINFLILCNI